VPQDLDAFVIGTRGSSTEYEVIAGGATSFVFDGETIVELDLDAGFGVNEDKRTETITIRKLPAGLSHSYGVRNFSKCAGLTNNDFSVANAKVEVYQGSSLIRTFFAPPTSDEQWRVFSLDDSANITVLNITQPQTNCFIE
jgi:hypothetical protein